MNKPKRTIKSFYKMPDCDTRIEIKLSDDTEFTVFLDYDTGMLKVLCNNPCKLTGDWSKVPMESYGHPHED